MEKEQVAVDEAVETVAEENTRAYSKTVWTETTPITADKLNKMETGIANAIDKSEQIMTIPIVSSQGWQQFRWTMPNYNTVSWTRDAKANKAVEIFNETDGKQLLLLGDDGGLDVQKHLIVNGGNNTEHADIFLKYNGAVRGLVRGVASGGLQLHSYNGNGEWLNYIEMGAGLITLGSNTKVEGNLAAGNLYAGNFSIENRDLKIHGKRALVGFNTAEGDYLELNYHRDFAAGVRIQGLTRIESIETPGKLTFSSQIGGGQMSSLINCQELQNNTGNGQMMTAFSNRIYVGNPNTHLTIESGSNPIVNVGGREYQLYHTGNKPTAAAIGALALTGGTLTGALTISGNSKGVVIGTGSSDVYLHNSASGKYLQLKDNGILMYSDNKVYHEGNKPTAADIGAMSTSGPTFSGNLNQNGPGGKDWIYHINADLGTLNIAPKNNGAPEWSKQILFDRNGAMFCNGNKKVATWDGNNPSHYMFRYGSGMGGANGYITFSY